MHISKLTVLSSDETVLEGVTARTAGDDSTTGHCDCFERSARGGRREDWSSIGRGDRGCLWEMEKEELLCSCGKE
jgi:hypothetical protein